MESPYLQIVFLILSVAGWIYCSFPTLRYLVDWSEGRLRWQLGMWFLILTVSIFLMKFSLFSLMGWPAPGTWASRLFFGFGLIGAYCLPFVREILSRWSKGESLKGKR
jgi:hypothetical protein